MNSVNIAKKMGSNQLEREQLYEDLFHECCARVEELSNHILDLEKIIHEYGLPIPNEHIEL